MFNRQRSPNDLELGQFGEKSMQPLPQGHRQVEANEDIETCPYMKIQHTQQQSQQQQLQVLGPDGKPKKQKKMKGGCPMMPSENKRNPGLYHMKEMYDIEFVSIYNYMLDQRGLLNLAFDTKELKKGPMNERRKVFDTYPIYLKHTIFQDEENTKKMRALEVAQRFFIYDRFREQGNKRIFKEEYDEAMKYYERALGCFKWLEYVEPPESEDEDDKNDENKVINEKKEETEEEKNLREEVEKYKLEQKEMKKQYRSLMKLYTDETVKLHDPAKEETDENNDKEMVSSVLFSLYLNMCVCYMHMGHFTLAQRVLEDASNIQENNSQLMFRKSQVLAYDNCSSLDKLYQAKQYIEQAIEMSNYEKIFQQEPGILRLMNLSNAKEMYVQQAHYVMKRINDKKQWIKEKLEKLFERAKEIEEIELEMISDGKTPFEDGVTNVMDEEDQEGETQQQQQPQESHQDKLYRLCGPQLSAEQEEYSIVVEMVNKYYRIIEFYTESKKPDQVSIAKKELQRMMETVMTMNFYLTVDFIDFKKHEVIFELQKVHNLDLTSKKIIRRLNKLCREQVTEIFNSSQFNFEVQIKVLDFALKDYFKKKDQQQKQKEEEEESHEPIKKQSWISKHIFSQDFFISLFIFILLAGGFLFLTNSGLKFFNGLGFSKK